jgi:glutamate formiminotransferase/formiminotetrahydrofolate cyclodeaminase
VGLLDRDMGDLLELFARGEGGAAAGSAAALVAATAAAVLARVARASVAGWADADAAAAQAHALLARLGPLAELDAAAYEAALERLSDREGPRGEQRDFRLRLALEEAAEVPLRIADAAADVVELAARLAERGDPASRPDAVGAAMLAEAATRAAAHLVEINLASDSDRNRLCRAAIVAAGAALERAIATND